MKKTRISSIHYKFADKMPFSGPADIWAWERHFICAKLELPSLFFNTNITNSELVKKAIDAGEL